MHVLLLLLLLLLETNTNPKFLDREIIITIDNYNHDCQFYIKHAARVLCSVHDSTLDLSRN